MAIQQLCNIQFNLQGDGAATTFTYSFSQLFEIVNEDGAIITSPDTIPSAVTLLNAAPPIPAGGAASLDGFGNLVLTFPSAWSGQGLVNIALFFNSGTLAGTTATWNSTTALNTTWTLPLNGNDAVLVPISNTGTITGGALQFFASADGVNWITIQGTIPSSFQTIAQWTLTSGATAIQFNVAGYSYFRVQLTTVITGTGSTTFIIQSIANSLVTAMSAGALAAFNTSAPTPSNGSSVPLQSDPAGNLFTNNFRRSQIVTATGNIASTTAANILAAQGAGIFADLTGLVLTCRLGATAAILFGVNISDGTKTYRFNLSSESTSTGGGNPPLALNFDPPLVATTANVAWTIALTSATDSPSVDYVATFVKQQAA